MERLTEILIDTLSIIVNNLLNILSGMFVLFSLYAIIGTSGNIEQIRKIAPQEIDKRGWNIERYEGFQYGSFDKHGGYAWYHVSQKDNKNIQYRVQISMWDGELQYYYGKPETLNRVNVNYNK